MKRLAGRLAIGLVLCMFMVSNPVMSTAANPCTDRVAQLPWPMFRHDICRTGAGSTFGGPGTVAGKVQMKGTLTSSPAVATGFGNLGLIYIAENKSDPAKLRAIQSTNGGEKWSADLGENGNGTAFPLVSSPAVSPDKKFVYIGTTDGKVFAFDAATGTEKWSYQTTDGTNNNIIVSSPVVSGDGKVVYIASIGQIAGYLWAFDALTGALIWKDKDGSAYASPALSPDGKIVYISSRRKIAVLAYDAGNGNFLWSSALEGTTVYSSTAVSPDGKVLYVGDENNNVYAIDASAGGNGNQLWKKKMLPDGSIRSSPAIGSDGFIYVGSTNSMLYKINAANGRLANFFKAGGAIISSPALDPFTVYVGSDDKSVYGIETATMKMRWSVATKGPVRSSPAIANLAAGAPFLIIVGSDDGILYVIK